MIRTTIKAWQNDFMPIYTDISTSRHARLDYTLLRRMAAILSHTRSFLAQKGISPSIHAGTNKRAACIMYDGSPFSIRRDGQPRANSASISPTGVGNGGKWRACFIRHLEWLARLSSPFFSFFMFSIAASRLLCDVGAWLVSTFVGLLHRRR